MHVILFVHNKIIKKGNNDDKTPDSAYGTKSSGSNANIHFTFSQHHDDAASTTNSNNTTSACSSSLMTASSPKSPRYIQRNPVTGSGIDDKMFKPRKGSFRKGNLQEKLSDLIIFLQTQQTFLLLNKFFMR